MIQRLCVIGVGLIGGSLARALRERGEVGEVIGSGRNEENLQAAVRLGVIDRYDTDPARAVVGADVVVVAVPLGAIEPVLRAIVPQLASSAVVTDVGSAKGSVVADVERIYGHIPPNFVPGHPIAGTEKSGVDASFSTLFQKRRVILTPLAETAASAHHLIQRMWELSGAEVIDMGVRHHDAVLAATSHLPHMLAYTLVDTLARLDDRAEIFRYAAGGFRDFSRIASSDPCMWHDICVANREQLLEMIALFGADLERLATAIRNDDRAAILNTFQRAKRARDNLYLD
ncbi:MAG: prephenate dehydrogenase/arogenate dehydrogenase family protein [Candidatus Competibacteraceae bacterium]|nr:prephenate dehydrogenase/arogenate dehydrogenase family protein [Candidatus Competibacteraceae bacterium]MBK8898586.1 prephenate dehydrogenase/arogenate dehydrogenase family protein [Candidatus Competibacteraceae bacterium]MBK8962390.1 prephenate dehydrogenase/arogenate dehydrogenase family protein [Candidatus Competibacteraceae bacterium]MBK9951605.1 prephenate dehydrogenase/arogenate dehydrogenase family protein [Candidatus Competibacteraceae bacterium]